MEPSARISGCKQTTYGRNEVPATDIAMSDNAELRQMGDKGKCRIVAQSRKTTFFMGKELDEGWVNLV